jgi:hypothetical protein
MKSERKTLNVINKEIVEKEQKNGLYHRDPAVYYSSTYRYIAYIYYKLPANVASSGTVEPTVQNFVSVLCVLLKAVRFSILITRKLLGEKLGEIERPIKSVRVSCSKPKSHAFRN